MAESNDLLGRLQAHLDQLEADPTTTEIDDRLFESATLVLPSSISKQDAVQTISQLSRILPVLQQDPTHPIQFLILLLEPFSYSDILGLNSGIDFVGGLHVAAIPYNRLMLALLKKATTNATDAESIAAQPELVTALVRLWLSTPDSGIADQAGEVLTALLKADQVPPPGAGEQEHLPAHSQGLMWKRVFGDEDVYELIFSICSLTTITEELSKSQRTLAQARLLDWLPIVGALNWNAITKAHHPSIEARYTDGKGEGILYFASACMVDTKDDILMHRCLIDFYAKLIEAEVAENSSAALDFLTTHKLHEKCLSFFLDPSNPRHDPVDVQFLYAPSANYLAAYASAHPQHFISSPIEAKTIAHLKQSLDISPSRWVHAQSPKHDLHVLASLPRVALLPTTQHWNSSPLSLLPSKSTNADVLDTLATIFHGPSKQEIINYPSSSPLMDTHNPHAENEAQASMALYYLYLNYNPQLFEDLAKHADVIALREQALAAINLISAIVTANWLPSTPRSTPTSAELEAWLPSPPTATPHKGHLAILAPPSLEHTLPYLLRPPQTFSSLVGGVGDTENSAYRVAMAKFDALKALWERVAEEARMNPGQGYEDVGDTLKRRVEEGPFGRQGEVGGRIATLEL